MFTESAELYDLIYSQFKDYEEEAQTVASLLKSIHPGARTILDVACGTGEHGRLLSQQHGFAVDGIDVEPDFVEITRQKIPAGNFWSADMTDFDLGRRYDVVMCLFSSIGYARTSGNVHRALSCFRRHLNSDGVTVVEPWFGPGVLEPGKVYMQTVEADDLKVCRVAHTDVKGRISKHRFEYLVGRSSGITHMVEEHELGLFTVDEMTDAFRKAGLDVEYDAEGLTGRGLYVGRAAA
jgi:ubiquinone/menaquinone biosynthesis C-methylase UbiE